MYNVLKNWCQNDRLIEQFTEIIQDPKIFWFGRLGGIDYEIALHYFWDNNFFENSAHHAYWLDNARKFPGYFDFASKKENFMLYVKKLVESFENLDACFYAGADLINKIDDNKYAPEDTKFLDHILEGKTTIHYSFAESVMPFLHSFKTWGEGKKILVVSPLSRSIEFQHARKDKIIKDYVWPNFELKTLNTSLTWQAKNDTRETLHITTNNWHEEVERLQDEISKIDFDIAWLSCGSYATVLGSYIKNLGKKAIYIGGIMNCLWGIRGDRYNTSYFNPLTPDAYKIVPLENDFVKKLQGGKTTTMESARAYFCMK